MKIWRSEEASDFPGVAMAVAVVSTPAGWRSSRSRAWVSHAGEALRSMFPNLPETIEGPWGSLPRSEVFGAEDACSAIMEAIEELGVSEGGKIDSAFERCSVKFSTQPLAERVEEGKTKLVDLKISQLSKSSHVAVVVIEPDPSLFLLDKGRALASIDEALDAIGEGLRRWMPTMTPLQNSARLSLRDMSLAMAMASRQEIERESPTRPSAPRKAGL